MKKGKKQFIIVLLVLVFTASAVFAGGNKEAKGTPVQQVKK